MLMTHVRLSGLCAVAAALVLCASCGPDSPRQVRKDALGGDPPPARVATGRGSIVGRVVYGGDPPHRAKLLVIKDRDVCGVVEHRDPSLIVSESGGIANVVVSVEGPTPDDGEWTSSRSYVLDQRDCAYEPHVIVVPSGVPLQILNSDGVLHNVHTFSEENRPVNVAQPASLTSMTMTFDSPERVRLRCDVHGWMDAWAVVVDHPHHAVTDADGKFTLPNVPAGNLALVFWHETLGEQTTSVVVEAESEAGMELVYPGPG
jgi:plastocyanin